MQIDRTKGASSLGRKLRNGLAIAAAMLTIGCTEESGSDDIYASAPLHKAVFDEQRFKVKQLLEAGADPNASGLFESFETLFGGRRRAGPGWPSI